MASLDELRRHLDDLDDRLIELIADRQRTSREIARVKRSTGHPTRDYGREREVILGARATAAKHGVPPAVAEELEELANLVEANEIGNLKFLDLLLPHRVQSGLTRKDNLHRLRLSIKNPLGICRGEEHCYRYFW